jgi:lipopolysaccharide biosynthesis glycosyltransferase
MHTIRIAITAWNAVALHHYRAVAHQVLRHDPGAHFHLIHNDGVPPQEVVAFRAFIAARDGVLHAKRYDLPLMPRLEVADPMFLKLVHLFAWADMDVDALLIIDNDVHVRTSLQHLFATRGSIAGVAECEEEEKSGLPHYTNGGVVLFRRSLLLTNEAEVLDFISHYDAAKYTWRRDEVFFSRLMQRPDSALLSPRWNWRTNALLDTPSARKLLGKKEPGIIHFSGPLKPWHCRVQTGGERYLEEYRAVAGEIARNAPITLCYAVDGVAQTEYAMVSAVSAAAHTRRPIELRLLSTSQDCAPEDWLQAHPRLAALFRARVHDVPLAWAAQGKCAHYTPAVFAKNLAPYILGEDRFVVADTDMLFRADIGTLADWHIPEHFPFAAMRLENWPMEPEYRKKRGLKNINGGLIVWNRHRALTLCPLEQCLKVMRDLRDADFTRFPDEDVFLWCFGNDWELLPETWNNIWSRFGNHCAVHFICNAKPWGKHKDTVPEYGHFSAFLEEWREHAQCVVDDVAPVFVGCAPLPPMLRQMLETHHGRDAVLRSPIWDGRRHYKAGDFIGIVGDPFVDRLLAATIATVADNGEEAA